MAIQAGENFGHMLPGVSQRTECWANLIWCVCLKLHELMCQRKKKILVFLLLPLLFIFYLLLLFLFYLEIPITEKFKDAEIDNAVSGSLVSKFSAITMEFSLLESKIRMKALPVLQFYFPFWKTEELPWLYSSHYKVYFSWLLSAWI